MESKTSVQDAAFNSRFTESTTLIIGANHRMSYGLRPDSAYFDPTFIGINNDTGMNNPDIYIFDFNKNPAAFHNILSNEPMEPMEPHTKLLVKDWDNIIIDNGVLQYMEPKTLDILTKILNNKSIRLSKTGKIWLPEDVFTFNRSRDNYTSAKQKFNEAIETNLVKIDQSITLNNTDNKTEPIKRFVTYKLVDEDIKLINKLLTDHKTNTDLVQDLQTILININDKDSIKYISDRNNPTTSNQITKFVFATQKGVSVCTILSIVMSCFIYEHLSKNIKTLNKFDTIPEKIRLFYTGKGFATINAIYNKSNPRGDGVDHNEFLAENAYFNVDPDYIDAATLMPTSKNVDITTITLANINDHFKKNGIYSISYASYNFCFFKLQSVNKTYVYGMVDTHAGNEGLICISYTEDNIFTILINKLATLRVPYKNAEAGVTQHVAVILFQYNPKILGLLS
jgi:hypothetical protein